MEIPLFLRNLVFVVIAIGIIGLVLAVSLGHRQLGIDMFLIATTVTTISMIAATLFNATASSGMKLFSCGFGVVFIGALSDFASKGNAFGHYAVIVGGVIAFIGLVINMFQVGQRW